MLLLLCLGEWVKSGEEGSYLITFHHIPTHCWISNEDKYIARPLTDDLKRMMEESQAEIDKLKIELRKVKIFLYICYNKLILMLM